MSETATETTATPTIDPIEVNGGDGAVTFDDLERVENQAKAAKRAEKDSVKETVKETVKALDKGAEKDAKKESAKKADDQEEVDKKKPGKEKEPPKLEKQADKKVLKGKLGDKEIDLDPETVISIKVDGKDENISIKDLQNHFNGKVAWDKRFSELAKEKQQFSSKVETANQKIKTMFEEKDPEMRFFHMAELSGKDPVEVRQKFLEENIKLLEKFYSMSEDERKADAKDFENKVLRHRLESKQKDDARRQTESALQAKIADLGKTHQVPEEAFWSRYGELQALKKQGTFQGKITPELIAETIVKDRLWKSASDILENSDSSLPVEKRGQALMDLVETAHMQGLSPKDVAELADEMWGSKAKASVIEEKVNEQEELRTGKKFGKKPDYHAGNDVTFFSDL